VVDAKLGDHGEYRHIPDISGGYGLLDGYLIGPCPEHRGVDAKLSNHGEYRYIPNISGGFGLLDGYLIGPCPEARS